MTEREWLNEVVDEETFDRLFAENMGPYLRIYVELSLDDQGTEVDAASVLEDLYAGFLASGVLIHSGTSRAFSTRIYGLAESALPHLGRPALRQPVEPGLRRRAQCFAEHTRKEWHARFEEHLSRLRAAAPKDRQAVLLRNFHRLSMHEIGQRLGMEKEEARAFVREARARVSGEG